MKKYIALLLILILIFSLCACNKVPVLQPQSSTPVEESEPPKELQEEPMQDYKKLSLAYTDIGPVMADMSVGLLAYIDPGHTAVVVEPGNEGYIGAKPWSESLYKKSGAAGVAVGDWHVAVLLSNGEVSTWGSNNFGQCNTSEWAQIVGISAGSYHTVGLKADGTVVAVGDDTYGQCKVGDWNNIVAVAAGNRHTVGLKSDGTIVATGANNFGQCKVDNISEIVNISAGANHTVFLKNDGTVITTGLNSDGECDTSHWKDIVAIDGGSGLTIGITAEGKLLVAGTCDKVNSPERFSEVGYAVAGAGRYLAFDRSGEEINFYYSETAPEDWENVKAVSGWYKTLIGLKEDGTVVTAGNNHYDQCNISHWSDIVQVSASSGFCVGLKKDGTVMFAGEDYDGKFNFEDWKDIIQISSGQHHVAGLKKDGTVVAVGDDEYGTLEVQDWTGIVKLMNYKSLGIRGYKKDGTVLETRRAEEEIKDNRDMFGFTLTPEGIEAESDCFVEFENPYKLYIATPVV